MSERKGVEKLLIKKNFLEHSNAKGKNNELSAFECLRKLFFMSNFSTPFCFTHMCLMMSLVRTKHQMFI